MEARTAGLGACREQGCDKEHGREHGVKACSCLLMIYCRGEGSLLSNTLAPGSPVPFSLLLVPWASSSSSASESARQ